MISTKAAELPRFKVRKSADNKANRLPDYISQTSEPQAKNIPYQPLLIKPIFNLLTNAEKNRVFFKTVFLCLLNTYRLRWAISAGSGISSHHR